MISNNLNNEQPSSAEIETQRLIVNGQMQDALARINNEVEPSDLNQILDE